MTENPYGLWPIAKGGRAAAPGLKPLRLHALRRGPSHQSRVLEHKDTYGQAKSCSGGHQGSSVNRRCQLSFVGIFWHLRSPLPQGNWLLLRCLSALPGRLGRGEFVLDGLGSKDKNQRTYYSYTTTAWWLSTLRCN